MLGKRVFAFLVLVVLSMLASGAPASVLPLDGKASDGRTYSDLTAAWWQWALSTPITVNPLTDPDGSYAHIGQNGPVWFLAPSYTLTTNFAYTRDITIPQGKFLFFPLLTSIAFNLPEEAYTEAELRQQVADFASVTSILYATIDSQQVPDLWTYRAASPEGGFQVELPVGNIYDLPSGIYGPPAATDGWWLLLEPLSLGSHQIIFASGTGDPSEPGIADFYQSTTYNIQVVPEPASLALLALATLLIRRRSVR